MVDRVNTDPGAGDTPPVIDTEDPQVKAALEAAEQGGVSINGEQVSTPEAEGDPEVTPRPDNVPEKFWDAEKGEVNVEALLKSNADLQAQFTKERQGSGEGDGEGEPEDTSEKPQGTATINSAMEEWDANGELSPETYIALEKAGFSPDIVNNYIAGHEARQELENQKAYNVAGGSKETFEAMIDWAKETLSKTEIEAFNAQVKNVSTSEYAVQQLYARYVKDADIEPSLIHGDGGNGQGSGSGFFASSKEMQTAMADKRYATDPAYRKEVEKKIIASEKAGVRLFG